MNPATRLHNILRAIKNDTGPNRPLRQAIADLFGITDAHSPEVIRSYVSILTLAMEVESRVRSIPGIDHDLYCRGIRQIQSRFATIGLDSDRNNFRNQIQDDSLHGLEFVSHQLDVFENEKDIPSEVLAKLIEQIDSVLNDIRDAKVDPDFRHFLYSNLSAVRQAMQNYRFFGSAGMRGAMAKVIGEMILDPRDNTQDLTKRSLLKRAMETIKDINQVVTFIRNGVEVSKRLGFDDFLKLLG